MVKETHTPGPWRIVRNYHGVLNVVGPDDDDGYSAKVALVNNKHDANAHLIAAAPDMLAALEDALAELSPLMMAYRAEHYDEICGKARASIAKAKGGAA